jgi:phage-related protein
MVFKKYVCYFYETPSGKRPVEDFIKSMDEHTQDKFFYKKELLEHFGPNLRHPHTDSIGNGLLELRFKGTEGQLRVLFFFVRGKKIILLHAFLKKKPKTPSKEIKIAEQRMNEYLNRK